MPSALALDDVAAPRGKMSINRGQALLLLEADALFLVFRGLALAGGFRFPAPVRFGMSLLAKVMTKSTYRI